MKKIINATALLLAAVNIIIFAGCSEAQVKDVDLKSVMIRLNQDYGIDNAAEITDKSRLNTYYGIEENDVVSFAAEIDERASTEIVLVKATDQSAAERVSDKLNSRLECKKTVCSSGYSDDGGFINKCETAINDGVYVRLIVAENAGEMVETYNDFF